MKVYLLKILTPEKRIYENKVVSVTVAGANGRLTVLAGHAPMIGMLTAGPIVIRTEQETIEGVTGHGLLRVDRKETAVMVRAFRWASDEREMASAEDTFAKDTLFLL